MTSLTQIVVRTDGPWDKRGELITRPTEHDHLDILIETALRGLPDRELAAIPAQDLHAAAEYVAGLLGRVLSAAQPWLDADRVEHGCSGEILGLSPGTGGPVLFGTCRGYGNLLDLADNEWLPALHLDVPLHCRDAWLGRIEDWLTHLAVSG